MAEKEGEEPVCKIEVRGYKVATEDEVEIYFKNTLGYGDTIVEFDPVNTDGVIFITFTNEEVARRVAEHQHVVNGCTLDVKLYEPPKHKSAKHLSRTIEVRGVNKSFNRNTLHLFFENEKRSGGDEIEMFEYQEENEIALITYKNEEVAQRVASPGQHEVDKQRFEVKMYRPPSPKPTYEDRVLLSGLTSKVTRDGLTNYLEAKVGQLPTNFLYSEEEEKLIITFNKNIDLYHLN